MKFKTMLKFLLCFLIIGNVFSFDNVYADVECFTCFTCGGTIEVDEKGNVKANACGTQVVKVGNAWYHSNTSSGGASDSFFFSAGKHKMNKIQGQIDGELSMIKHIQGLIMSIGVFAAVIVTLIYAIQWLTATSARRQELKAGLWPLLIGVILLVIGPKLVITIYNTITNAGSDTAVGTINNAGQIVISLIRAVGGVVAVIMVLIVGIQWLVATPNKRQELKGRMINILIGAVLLVAGVSILGVIEDVATGTKNKSFTETYKSSQINECIKTYKV